MGEKGSFRGYSKERRATVWGSQDTVRSTQMFNDACLQGRQGLVLELGI